MRCECGYSECIYPNCGYGRAEAARKKKLILVYGLAKGVSERYMEELLASRCKDAADVEKVKAAAAKDGWHSFRVAEMDENERPDFLAALKRS